ncbi:hypothetical protein [Candidatus Nitrosopumilus sediminis]|uniref:Uncharacterized protein n=1 Tax=Candidatus Nitrosopumilus sediminis TaxID=1229909 RepID=K0BCB3_9ARCH|nr:hypothetical protein [Candidatus Nitrosopumilus sediminis]AFS82747.1 hypothetical protein NSED_04715 [Candidatus Nitrosopumilus sediminis]
MAEKKTVKKTTKKTPEKKATKAKATKAKATKAKATKAKATKAKTKKIVDEPSEDLGIVIVDDDIEIDQEKVNEERRAYLEEARSQEAFD